MADVKAALHREDQRALDLRGFDQSPSGLGGDQHSEDEEADPVDLGGEDLGSFEAEGHRAFGRAPAEIDRDQREGDRGVVGQYVPASESGAKELATIPTTTSTAMKADDER